jgi:hypothetical protein
MANLKPFPPGVSGNPAGAKPGKRWRTILAELMELPANIRFDDPDKETLESFESKLGRKLTNRELISIKQIKQAKDGSVAAFKALSEREEGRPAAETEDLSSGGSYLDFLDSIKEEEPPKDDE